MQDTISTSQNTSLPGKSLPPDIRSHFEANSSAFIEFANRKDAGLNSKVAKPNLEESWDWDRALLFGEYPGEKTIQKTKEASENKPSVSIPKKPVPDNSLAEKKEEPTNPSSNDIPIEKITLPRFVPKKQENPIQTAIPQKNSPKMSIPLKPKQVQ